MSEANNQEKRYSTNTVLRNEKLKQIDALYRNQIKEIYAESRTKVDKTEIQRKVEVDPKKSNIQIEKKVEKPKPNFNNIQSPNSKSTSTLNAGESSANSKVFNFIPENDQKVRASIFLKGESTRTFEILRKENETKQLKIRQLSNKCQALVQKLRVNLEPVQFEKQMENLKEYSDSKMQRLENLFKIKNEEIFFKIKLQVINLLQQFGVQKEELAEMNDISSESEIFTFMAKKLKHKLKDFRSKEQESTFELQKDKILNQKQEERIHYLIETNELLRLSESKLKGKVEDFKNQLNEFLERLKEKQQQNQQMESQLFQLKKQNEELISNNTKLVAAAKAVNSEKIDERRTWQAKEKEMKTLLSNYYVEKQKLESELEESEDKNQEMLIKIKFLQQENERIGRELVRWKQRYEGLEKDNDRKVKELQEQLNNLENQFEEYKIEHNQGILIGHRTDIEEALRKVEEYQRAYEAVLLQLDEQKRLVARAEEQNEERVERLEKQWLERVKRLERIREEELFEFQSDHQARQLEIREEYQRKEELFAEQMQANMRALLAEKDKKTTEQLVELEAENDELRREVVNLKEFLRAKEDFIKAIKHHSM